ncbi:hypothetical protein B2D07_16270 [Desulfococcus multivorans]|uniref:O-antigen polymerase n=2 Tax=Desulfococcus multivorans TaxID=897 RepID=S7TFL4_DESML|nr:hypothetical protein B2D07_16270 [Desulfococcus multivorans]EPR36017.1 hypothetical protein dsmv_0722 [Desulfococcus multivorans DSM 2059]SJZ36904.1 hypothetical protein SAMN02745446_00240 [Desulfococcus multivorans DSM 2059]
MNYLVYLLFFFVYIIEYVIKKIGLELKVFAILPEMISMVVGVYVLLYFALYRKMKVQPRYLFFYFVFTVHIAIGLIGNQVQPFAILAGIRTYFKFLPFYFLPMICDISDEKMKGHLIALLSIAVLQFPLALYQRLFEYAHMFSGDYIAGTLTAAPILTLFLICTIAVLIGFYLKKRIALKTFAILVAVSFLPTAINETKATIILLPLAILLPTIFGVNKASRVKVLAGVIPALVITVMGFSYIYDNMYARNNTSVIEFYTEGNAADYLYKGKDAEYVIGGIETEASRIDSIIYAYQENADDLFRLFWGVGIGNAGVAFSRKLQGEYTDEYRRLGGKQTGLGHFIWEIGLLGILYILWFMLLVLSDAMKLREQTDISGAVALGWTGVVAVLVVAMPYQHLITQNGLMYPFVYISGFLAAKRYLMERTETGSARALQGRD